MSETASYCRRGKDNLIPWSIVSFDVKKRTPEQRLEMLQQLGFDQYAYGNRPEHQATMLPELRLAKEKSTGKRHGIIVWV